MRWVRSVTVLRIGLILSLRALFKHERFDSLEKKSPQRTHARSGDFCYSFDSSLCNKNAG